MSWRYYSYFKTSTPIRVDGGIKAKSRRGDIGDTWWSKKWVKVLESFGWKNRLERGRRYARSGQVLEFNISTGKIIAKVQGSVRKPYVVTIQITRFQAKEWKNIVNIMGQKAIFAAKLLAGEMPQNIEEVFDSAGKTLFPNSKKDIKTNCSCPDSANPCKHIAAVYYILAEEFDRDPFMIFEIRGHSKKEITAHLRDIRSTNDEKQNTPINNNEDKMGVQNTKPLINIENFWTGTELKSFSVNIAPPEVSASVIKRLGTPEFWTIKEDFIKLMENYYNDISEKTIALAYDGFEFLGGEEENYLKKNSNKTQIDEVELELQEVFKNETRKNAIWGGKETKGFLEWKKKRKNL